MNDFQKDKIIKLKFNTNDEMPENINNIFDKFIDKSINNSSKSKIVKFSKCKKILSAVASTMIVILAGGTIYAAITGRSLINLFNINKEKYQNDIVSVNEQITSQGITVELTEYAVDHNSIIVNYQISSNKTLNFSNNKDNIVAKSKVNKDSIELNIDNQKYAENDGIYTVSTLYSIEQFEELLNEFTFDIEITEIASCTGNWNFRVNIDKSEIKDNRKYSFYDHKNLKDTNRIPIKTSYMPISMNVGTVSVSDFSTVINMTFFNNQNGINDGDKIEPKKILLAQSPEVNNTQWNETERFFIEIQNDNGEVLDFEDYDYTREKMIRYEKIIFPNLSVDCDNLTLKIYLKNDNAQKDLVGEIKLELSEDNIEKYNFNISKTLNNGQVTYKVPDNWRIYNLNENSVNILTMDDFGNTVDLSLKYIKSSQYNEFGINEYSSLEDIATNNSNIKYEFSNGSKEHKIISQGEQQYGNISGYQITYSLKLSDSNVWDMKIKNFYFYVKDDLYLVSINADGEVAVENYIDIFENFISNIECKNMVMTNTDIENETMENPNEAIKEVLEDENG